MREAGPKVKMGDQKRDSTAEKSHHVKYPSKPVSDPQLKVTTVLYNLSPSGKQRYLKLYFILFLKIDVYFTI